MKLDEILRLTGPLLEQPLREAITIIDSVHTFPTSPRLSVCPVVINQRRQEQGAYHYRSRPSVPLRIEISRHARHVHWTLAHEVGHLMDHMVLNPIRSGFGSEHDPLFDRLRELWAQSGSMTTLARLLGKRVPRVSAVELRNLRDHLRPREFWARTYAQWVASRAGSDVLRIQLAKVRREGLFLGHHWFTFQWEDDEFKIIMGEVDNLMREAHLV